MGLKLTTQNVVRMTFAHGADNLGNKCLYHLYLIMPTILVYKVLLSSVLTNAPLIEFLDNIIQSSRFIMLHNCIAVVSLCPCCCYLFFVFIEYIYSEALSTLVVENS